MKFLFPLLLNVIVVVMSRAKVPEEVLAYVCISIHPREHYPRVVNNITKMDLVKEVYGVTGEYDLLIKLQSKSIREFSEILGDNRLNDWCRKDLYHACS